MSASPPPGALGRLLRLLATRTTCPRLKRWLSKLAASGERASAVVPAAPPSVARRRRKKGACRRGERAD